MPQSPSACRYTRTAPSTRRHVESAPRRCHFQETRKTTAAPRQAGEKPCLLMCPSKEEAACPSQMEMHLALAVKVLWPRYPRLRLRAEFVAARTGLAIATVQVSGTGTAKLLAVRSGKWQQLASLVWRGSFSYRVLCLSVRMGTDTTCRLNRWMEIDGKRRWLSRLMFFFWDRQEKL